MKIKKSKKKNVAAAAPASKKSKRASQFRSLDDVCKPDMIAFHFWREWHRARERNDYDFMFEMAREGSELRETFGERDAFPEACRRREDHIPGLQEGELMKISLEGPDFAHMFEVIHPRRQTGRKPVEVRRWFMLRGAAGWRLESLSSIEVPPNEVLDRLTIGDFPDVSAPDGFETRTDALEKAKLGE